MINPNCVCATFIGQNNKGETAMHMVANFWPGATLEQFQVELAQLEDKKQPQIQMRRRGLDRVCFPLVQKKMSA